MLPGLPGYRDGLLAFFLLGTQSGSRAGGGGGHLWFPDIATVATNDEEGRWGKGLSRNTHFQHCNCRLGHVWATSWTPCPVLGLAEAKPLRLFFSVRVTEEALEATAPHRSHSTRFCHPPTPQASLLIPPSDTLSPVICFNRIGGERPRGLDPTGE